MTSKRKAQANRENAKRSTGPRSAPGKRRSSQNAVRHGLAAACNQIRAGSPEVEQLARAIAGKEPSAARLHYARIAAEAEIMLRFTQEAIANRIDRAISDSATFTPKPRFDFDLCDEIRRVLDPVSAAKLGPKAEADAAAASAGFENAIALAEESERFYQSRPMPEEADRPAIAFMAVGRELRRYQRYERRAFSKLKRALRGLRGLNQNEEVGPRNR